ncbi:hypothetical protein D0Z08_00700 [Nocardioides immobilis]|uniref:Uncharacterized protein n=1 Tax=Nocardioides immobilis TaxID=2049295 RepID=A0A417Y8Z3_9ACTN|nr:hypothetical protein [Nocardioides immobilis]RHW29055.1 hypothetical protein D0Z08_00700 [Nocardioides immobilis]
MSDSTSINHSSHADQALRLRSPVAIVIVLFTVSYPANDFYGAESDTDIGFGVFLIYVAIALTTAIVVFAVVMPWAIRRQWIGVVALTLSLVGFLLAPGFWTGVPPAVAAGGALLGWAGVDAAKGRRLSQAALVIGVLGVIANAYSYADVFV